MQLAIYITRILLRRWIFRYGLAFVAVAAGFGLRTALTAWFGPGLAVYITFYPAVMVVALLAGFGPGLVATLAAALVADYWLIPPVGHLFTVENTIDAVGLAFFTGMGLFMSAVAEFYRRDRRKAAAYNREQDLRASQEALRRSEALLRAITDNSPDPVFMKDHDGRMLLANPATLAVLQKRTEEVLGKTDEEFYADPAIGRSMMANDRRVMESGRTEVVEEVVPGPSGPRTFLTAKTPCRDADGRVTGVIGIARDTTEQKQRQAVHQQLYRTVNALKNSGQAMMRAQEEPEYLNAVCRIVAEDCGHAMVWIGFAEEDAGKTVRPVAQAGFEAGYLENLKLTWADVERGRGPTGTATRTGKPSRCLNMLTDPNFAPWREDAINRGYASSLVLPLLTNGKAFGALTIYSKQPDSFSPDEVDLLSELASDLAHGITTHRLRLAHDQAETALRQSEEQLRLFIEHAPAALAMFDREMRYLSTSRRWMSDYGLGDRDLRGWSHYQVFPETSERWKAVHRRALAGEVVRADEDHFERADGSVRWLQWEVRPWHNPAGEVVGIVIFSEDITVRKSAEEALRALNGELEQRVAERTAEVRAAARYARNLIETSLDALVTISAEGKITDVNHATELVTGVPREQLIGSNFSDYFTEPDRASAGYRQVLAKGQVRDYPLTLRHLSGRMTEVLYHATVYRDAAGRVQGVFAAARDVTERIRMEQEHLGLLRRLAEAQEMERSRISRELHDQLGQELTALKLELQIVRKQGSLSAPVQQCLSQADALADSLMQDIHRLAWELRPSVLDDFGLAPALQRYVAKWSEHAGVPADFHSHGMGSARLPAEMETTLYRGTQEALNNVIRHAKAGRVSVLLERRPRHVSLIVEDDGRGFDTTAALKSGRLGLLGMQERAKLAGGTFEIESTPGSGTTVFVRIPLTDPASGTKVKRS